MIRFNATMAIVFQRNCYAIKKTIAEMLQMNDCPIVSNILTHFLHYSIVFLGFSCLDNEFQCNTTNECISMLKVCDLVEDCPNGEDELDCMTNISEKKVENFCDYDEFQCHDRLECIPVKYVCDKNCKT